MDKQQEQQQQQQQNEKKKKMGRGRCCVWACEVMRGRESAWMGVEGSGGE
jgi:hypothetical protein